MHRENLSVRQVKCGTYRAAPLRVGLLAAYDVMDATTSHFAYAACRPPDGLA
jgi:hypothetical protein